MTDELRRLGSAYQAIPSDAYLAIFADLRDHVKTSITGAQEKAGAWELLGHLMNRRDLLRRLKAPRPAAATPPASKGPAWPKT